MLLQGDHPQSGKESLLDLNTVGDEARGLDKLLDMVSEGER